jgi:hypothetical protein
MTLSGESWSQLCFGKENCSSHSRKERERLERRVRWKLRPWTKAVIVAAEELTDTGDLQVIQVGNERKFQWWVRLQTWGTECFDQNTSTYLDKIQNEGENWHLKTNWVWKIFLIHFLRVLLQIITFLSVHHSSSFGLF